MLIETVLIKVPMIFEKIPTRIFIDSQQPSFFVAHEITQLIQQKNK